MEELAFTGTLDQTLEMVDDVATGGGALDASAFFGQDTNALERMASDFGTTVVTSILEAF